MYFKSYKNLKNIRQIFLNNVLNILIIILASDYNVANTLGHNLYLRFVIRRVEINQYFKYSSLYSTLCNSSVSCLMWLKRGKKSLLAAFSCLLVFMLCILPLIHSFFGRIFLSHFSIL